MSEAISRLLQGRVNIGLEAVDSHASAILKKFGCASLYLERAIVY